MEEECNGDLASIDNLLRGNNSNILVLLYRKQTTQTNFVNIIPSHSLTKEDARVMLVLKRKLICAENSQQSRLASGSTI